MSRNLAGRVSLLHLQFEPIRLVTVPAITEEVVDRAQPRAGHYALPTDVFKSCAQVAKQSVLQVINRREVGMTALACERNPASSVPVKPRLAQAGAGSNDGGVPLRVPISLAHNGQVFRFQDIDPEGDGLQVVDKRNGLQAQLLLEPRGIDRPR